MERAGLCSRCVERAAILRAPADADRRPWLKARHAFRIRHFDNEVGATQYLNARTRMVAEVNQLFHPSVELIGSTDRWIDANPLRPQRERGLRAHIVDIDRQRANLP